MLRIAFVPSAVHIQYCIRSWSSSEASCVELEEDEVWLGRPVIDWIRASADSRHSSKLLWRTSLNWMVDVAPQPASRIQGFIFGSHRFDLKATDGVS